jgi:hypothetical protein
MAGLYKNDPSSVFSAKSSDPYGRRDAPGEHLAWRRLDSCV